MLYAFQSLFLAHNVWDFFIAVFAGSSQEALVLHTLGGIIPAAVIACWALMILVLACTLFYSLFFNNGEPTHNAFAEYGVLIGIFLFFAYCAWINPFVSWAVVFNYCLTAFWASMMIYFKECVIKLYRLNRKYSEPKFVKE